MDGSDELLLLSLAGRQGRLPAAVHLDPVGEGGARDLPAAGRQRADVPGRRRPFHRASVVRLWSYPPVTSGLRPHSREPCPLRSVHDRFSHLTASLLHEGQVGRSQSLRRLQEVAATLTDESPTSALRETKFRISTPLLSFCCLSASFRFDTPAEAENASGVQQPGIIRFRTVTLLHFVTFSEPHTKRKPRNLCILDQEPRFVHSPRFHYHPTYKLLPLNWSPIGCSSLFRQNFP